MDKRKIENIRVKNSLADALMEIANTKKWSAITVSELIKKANVARSSFYRNFNTIDDVLTYGIDKMVKLYKDENPYYENNLFDRNLVLFNFKFYQKYAYWILSLHKAQAPQTLLTAIDEATIDIHGHMPNNSISRYQLYFFSGSFYNVVIHWLEDGAKESPEEMTDEFLKMFNK